MGRWYQWLSPWYIAYALLGAIAVGILPILIPLASSTGGAARIGMVMAALNLGGMSALISGLLCDRFRLHKTVAISGLLILTISTALFPFFTDLISRTILAILIGTGIAAASTVANLLIVEVYPKEQWDSRIGWLQTAFCIGQVAGLILASPFSNHISAGLLTTSVLAIIAVIVSVFTIHTPGKPLKSLRAEPTGIRHGEWGISSPDRAHHHLSIKALRGIKMVFTTPFGIFLLAWLFVYTGAAGIFSLYPVLYQHLYNVNPQVSSIGFAASVAIGLFLYAPSGKLSERFGANRVLNISILIRLIAFLLLWLLTFSKTTHTGYCSVSVYKAAPYKL